MRSPRGVEERPQVTSVCVLRSRPLLHFHGLSDIEVGVANRIQLTTALWSNLICKMYKTERLTSVRLLTFAFLFLQQAGK
jgi:hypothetical protein